MVLKRKNSVELIQVLILLIALNGIETDNGYTYGGIRYGLLIALNGIETQPIRAASSQAQGF